MGRLEGKVAFITGAGSGIGRAAAKLFSAEGARVAVADIDAAAGRETVRQINEAGHQAIFVETDVTDEASVKAAIARTVATYGKLDVLYNNAGGSTDRDSKVTDGSVEEFWRVIGVDLFGTWLCSKYGIPEIVKAGGGAVVNMTSNVALMAVPGRDSYTAAKGGVAAMTRSMAAEYARDKVRVNAIAPSVTLTPRVRRLLEKAPGVSELAAKHLVGLAEPEDVARAALFLASDEARITTGHILTVDSGTTIS
jgi:NAD(P)-dependent dehydrogenase (short-subunit alcohol dehydrogenase family)